MITYIIAINTPSIVIIPSYLGKNSIKRVYPFNITKNMVGNTFLITEFILELNPNNFVEKYIIKKFSINVKNISIIL